MTVLGCCGIIHITQGIKVVQFEKNKFIVSVTHCSNCGDVKATSYIRKYNMAGSTLMIEKAGQSLKVDYFVTETGAGIRCFVNNEFLKEEIYEGKSIHWAESAAQNWLDGIKTLNG